MKYVTPFACALLMGLVLGRLGVPNGLLLGAIMATLVVCRIYPQGEPPPLSLPFVQLTLGFSIGLMFRSWSWDYAVGILPSLALLMACLAAQVTAGYTWLHRRCGWSRLDALLAAYPGAMAAVLDLLDRRSASPKVVLVHLMRLLLLTLVASLLVREAAPALPLTSPTVATWGAALAVVALSALFGHGLGRVGVPAPFMVTCIVLTAVATRAGFLAGFVVPGFVLDAAVVALGLLITIKFRELSLAEAVRSARSGLTAVVLAFIVTAVFAGIGSLALGIAFPLLALSYVPGAVESVAVVALAAQLDVAFIITHHLLRLFVVHLAPLLLIGRSEAAAEPTPPPPPGSPEPRA
jgi:hypothetical protein